MDHHRATSTSASRQDEHGSSPSRRGRPVVEVLHQDSDLIVVNKPAGTGLEVGPDDQPGIAEHLAAMNIITDSGEGLHCVLPVDVDASGLLLLGRTPEAAEYLRRQLGEGTLDHRMLAIVRAQIQGQEGTFDWPIAERDRTGLPRIDERSGTPARTDWRLGDAFIGFALLECLPRTAVRCQIRVHLQRAGMPLAVDRAYGGAGDLRLSTFKANYKRSRRRPERPLIQRLSLHSASVALRHPKTGEALRFEAPPPKDFRAALHQLAKYGRIPPG